MMSESGMAVSVMMVVRKLSKNKNRIMMIKINPSRKACSTLVSEVAIKLFC